MADTDFHINFDAPAVLRKWPSLNWDAGHLATTGGEYVASRILDRAGRRGKASPTSDDGGLAWQNAKATDEQALAIRGALAEGSSHRCCGGRI
jgi:hypothetical protein